MYWLYSHIHRSYTQTKYSRHQWRQPASQPAIWLLMLRNFASRLHTGIRELTIISTHESHVYVLCTLMMLSCSGKSPMNIHTAYAHQLYIVMYNRLNEMNSKFGWVIIEQMLSRFEKSVYNKYLNEIWTSSMQIIKILKTFQINYSWNVKRC